MLFHRLAGGGGVTAQESLEDAVVFLVGKADVLAGVALRVAANQVNVRLNAGQLVEQDRVGGAVVNELVQAGVRGGVDLEVALAQRSGRVVEHLAQVVQVRAAHARRGKFGGQPFQRAAHVEDIAHVVLGEFDHLPAARAGLADEALLHQALQRLPHWRGADAQLRGQVLDDDRLAGGQAAGDDVLAQGIVGLFGQVGGALNEGRGHCDSHRDVYSL